jgi:hypothetical protein
MVAERPVFTGDIFFDVEVQGVGAVERKDILVIQHPCALRTNGIDLTDTLMVVEVAPYQLLKQSQWLGNTRVMPLPELVDGNEPHRAGLFTSSYLVIPDSLDPRSRFASMTQSGVNLLMQRWVYHNSRVVIPTWKYDDAVSAQYEEADGIEEWCTIRGSNGVGVDSAAVEATRWFDDDGGGGISRRRQLENRQYRSSIRKAMRKYARELNQGVEPKKPGSKD